MIRPSVKGGGLIWRPAAPGPSAPPAGPWQVAQWRSYARFPGWTGAVAGPRGGAWAEPGWPAAGQKLTAAVTATARSTAAATAAFRGPGRIDRRRPGRCIVPMRPDGARPLERALRLEVGHRPPDRLHGLL